MQARAGIKLSKILDQFLPIDGIFEIILQFLQRGLWDYNFELKDNEAGEFEEYNSWQHYLVNQFNHITKSIDVVAFKWYDLQKHVCPDDCYEDDDDEEECKDDCGKCQIGQGNRDSLILDFSNGSWVRVCNLNKDRDHVNVANYLEQHCRHFSTELDLGTKVP
jgi:hypothetical protein